MKILAQPVRVLVGDVIDGLRSLPAASVHCCVTSPPYWALRDYGVDGQIGLEATPEAYIAKMVEVMREVGRVLRDDGTLWLNIGDSYNAGGRGGNPNGPSSTLQGGKATQEASMVKRYKRKPSATAEHGGWTETENGAARVVDAAGKPKDLMMMPWRVALALQADGWWIRSVIVWHKRSPMPESATDRPTTAWEPIFLMSRSPSYFYDAEAVKESTEDSNTHSCGPAPIPGPKTVEGIDLIKANTSFQAATWHATVTRNQRNVWRLSSEPYSEAHFACFPTEIPRRAIKAGTSERGCCPACGAPWTRLVEREKITRERPNDYTKRDGADGTGNSCANSVAGIATRTVGWKPGCECNAGEPVPCVVLDPFLGSGTTIAVARELGRHGVGCELNPQYAELARKRIADSEAEAPLFLTREKIEHETRA